MSERSRDKDQKLKDAHHLLANLTPEQAQIFFDLQQKPFTAHEPEKLARSIFDSAVRVKIRSSLIADVVRYRLDQLGIPYDSKLLNQQRFRAKESWEAVPVNERLPSQPLIISAGPRPPQEQ